MNCFSPATPTPRGCTQQPKARYRKHCMLKNGRGNERQLRCLQFIRPSRQADCARKNRQLDDLYVLITSLLQGQLNSRAVLQSCPLHMSVSQQSKQTCCPACRFTLMPLFLHTYTTEIRITLLETRRKVNEVRGGTKSGTLCLVSGYFPCVSETRPTQLKKKIGAFKFRYIY